MEVTVKKIEKESIEFSDGYVLYSDHCSDCCEYHWMETEDLTIKDFEGLVFDLSNDNFFKRIKEYGIELTPIKGHSVKIPCYGNNNGYYSDQLDLILGKDDTIIKTYDITECQEVTG